jgi:hypothetical protein
MWAGEHSAMPAPDLEGRPGYPAVAHAGPHIEDAPQAGPPTCPTPSAAGIGPMLRGLTKWSRAAAL